MRFKNIQHRWVNGKCAFCGASESEYGGKKREGRETHVNDVPDRPYFFNQPVEEDDENEEETVVYPIPKPQPAPKAAEKPIVPRTPITPKTTIPPRTPITPKTTITPRTPITPTYRPAFVPPTPATPAPKLAEKPKVDVSNVGPGTVVIHKAFGEGVVSKIDPGKGGSTYIRVKFGKDERAFGFPGAFYDGFLKVKE